jgi:hypothetical protein
MADEKSLASQTIGFPMSSWSSLGGYVRAPAGETLPPSCPNYGVFCAVVGRSRSSTLTRPFVERKVGLRTLGRADSHGIQPR